jgi:hypothetical protein
MVYVPCLSSTLFPSIRFLIKLLIAVVSTEGIKVVEVMEVEGVVDCCVVVVTVVLAVVVAAVVGGITELGRSSLVLTFLT